MQNQRFHAQMTPQEFELFQRNLAHAPARRGNTRPVAVERRVSVPAVAGAASIGLAAGIVGGFLIGWRSAAEWL